MRMMKRDAVRSAVLLAVTACASAACGGPEAQSPASKPGGTGDKRGLVTTAPPKGEPNKLAKDASMAPTNQNQFWWPERLDLSPLRQQDAESDPMGKDFKYAEAFKKLDLKAVKADIANTIKTSQAWWPADYGSYAPFFIRMAWHSAGT